MAALYLRSMSIENEEQQQPGEEQVKADIRTNVFNLWQNARRFIKSVLSLRTGLDKAATIEGIRLDVEFKGHAAWILVCSVLIASIGLGENNIPVIVGAMLISPLMGPILGIGLASGTNNFELLKKSLVNFSIAIVISLIISTIYFLINPVFNVTQELLSRKTAVLTAIAIAFLGGAAGIIAGSRSFKSNVVPGVAIATALMPPLCTAGYGLATWQGDYFFGAMYLFLINSVFIALPTYLYIRYMGFPMKEFVDPLRAKKIKRYIVFFIILIMVPSVYGFVQVVKRSIFESRAGAYVHAISHELEGTGSRLIHTEAIYTDTLRIIQLDLTGKIVPVETQAVWEKRLESFNLHRTRIEVYQDDDPSMLIASLQEQSREDQRDLIHAIVRDKESEIDSLETELRKFVTMQKDFSSIARQARLQFPNLMRMGFSDQIEINYSELPDTIATVMIAWDETSVEDVELTRERLRMWLLAKLDAHEIRLIDFPNEDP